MIAMNRPATTRLPRRIPLLSRLFSDEGLTKKAYLNALAAGLDYAVRLGVAFFINPLIVSGVGSFAFGAWKVLGSMVGYVSAAGGRPTQTLKWTIANLQTASPDIKRRNVGSAIAVAMIFMPVIGIAGAALTWFAPGMLNTPPEMVIPVRIACAILVLNLMMTSLIHIPQSVLQGENLGYKRMGISAVLGIANGALLAGAVFLDAGIAGLSIANLIGTLLSGGLFLIIVRTYLPWFGMARPQWQEIRKFFNLSAWFMIWRLVMRLMLTSDIVLLGIVCSAEFVTTYTLTKYGGETLISLAAILVGGVTPGLGGIIGAGDLKRASRVRGEIMILSWLLITAVGTTLLAWNQPFVELWVGADHYAGNISTLLIMVMMLQLVLIRNDANIIDLTLDLKKKVLVGALSCGVCLALGWAMVHFLDGGIPGICIGFILGRLILTIGYPAIIGRFLQLSIWNQIKAALRPLAATSLLFAVGMGGAYFATPMLALAVAWAVVLILFACYRSEQSQEHDASILSFAIPAFVAMVVAVPLVSIKSVLPANTWPGLVLATGTTFLAASLVAFHIGLTSPQRASVLSRATSLAKSRKGK